MLANPLISVIIPVYNVAPYLSRCLDSVCQQTYQNLEIILVDDGSTDNSLEICNQYAAKDKRITVIHQENGGVSAARNAGLKKATGGLISFVDADDWLELQSYQFLATLYINTNADLSAAQKQLAYPGQISPNGSSAQPENIQELTLEDFLTWAADNKDFFLWNKLFRRSIITTPFCEGQTLAEDWDFVFNTAQNAHKIISTAFVFYNYYQRPQSAIYTLSAKARLQSFKTWKNCYEWCVSKQLIKAAQAILPIAVGTASLFILISILQSKDSFSTLKEPYLWLKKHHQSLSTNTHMGRLGILFSKLFIKFPKMVMFCCRLPGVSKLLTYVLRKRVVKM